MLSGSNLTGLLCCLLLVFALGCGAKADLLTQAKVLAVQAQEGKNRLANPRNALTKDQVCNEAANICALAKRACDLRLPDYVDDPDFMKVCNEAQTNCNNANARCRGEESFKQLGTTP